MTEYIRDLPAKIVTKEVLRKDPGCKGAELIFVGWKVYINGAKYPEKPMEYYALIEDGAIRIAIDDYKRKHGV